MKQSTAFVVLFFASAEQQKSRGIFKLNVGIELATVQLCNVQRATPSATELQQFSIKRSATESREKWPIPMAEAEPHPIRGSTSRQFVNTFPFEFFTHL